MPEYIEGADDFRIKYDGCYAKVLKMPEDAPKEAEAIVKIGSDIQRFTHGGVKRVGCTAFFRGTRGLTKGTMEFIEAKDLDLNPLPLGCINMPKSVAILFSQKPQGNSKYRKLPCDGNMQVMDPFSAERDYLGQRQVTTVMDYGFLRSWANNEYVSAVDALKSVMDHERLGHAFSPEYFFGISLAGDGIFLFHSGRRVARVNSNGEVCLKPAVHWLTEQLSEYGLNVKRIEK